MVNFLLNPRQVSGFNQHKKCFFQVHVVKDATRGATLEVVVSRMKAVNSYRTSQSPEAGVTMRLVAVSATIPNICDVGVTMKHVQLEICLGSVSNLRLTSELLGLLDS